MNISGLSKDQWISVVKNAAFAGLVAFALALQAGGNLDAHAFLVAGMAGGMAAVKIVEKLLTPVN